MTPLIIYRDTRQAGLISAGLSATELSAIAKNERENVSRSIERRKNLLQSCTLCTYSVSAYTEWTDKRGAARSPSELVDHCRKLSDYL